MSLEDKIQGLREAIDSLTAALTVPGIKPFIPDVTHNPKPVKAEDQLTPAKAEVAPPKSPPTQKPVEHTIAPSTSPATETSATTLTIDYAQVAKAITDTFKVDRVKTIAALAKFGAAKGPQLKVEDYAAFLKELTE